MCVCESALCLRVYCSHCDFNCEPRPCCVANANVTFWIQIKLGQMRTGQSIPVGQQNLVFINMQMLPLFQSAAQRPAEGKNTKHFKVKSNWWSEQVRQFHFTSGQTELKRDRAVKPQENIKKLFPLFNVIKMKSNIKSNRMQLMSRNEPKTTSGID